MVMSLRYPTSCIPVGSNATSYLSTRIKMGTNYIISFNVITDSCLKIFPIGQKVRIFSQEKNHMFSLQADKDSLYSKYDSHIPYCRMFPAMLVVECFPQCLFWNVFLQDIFCKVFYRVCCGISSHKACCGLVPTSLVQLAYNSKS